MAYFAGRPDQVRYYARHNKVHEANLRLLTDWRGVAPLSKVAVTVVGGLTAVSQELCDALNFAKVHRGVTIHEVGMYDKA